MQSIVVAPWQIPSQSPSRPLLGHVAHINSVKLNKNIHVYFNSADLDSPSVVNPKLANLPRAAEEPVKRSTIYASTRYIYSKYDAYYMIM